MLEPNRFFTRRDALIPFFGRGETMPELTILVLLLGLTLGAWLQTASATVAVAMLGALLIGIRVGTRIASAPNRQQYATDRYNRTDQSHCYCGVYHCSWCSSHSDRVDHWQGLLGPVQGMPTHASPKHSYSPPYGDGGKSLMGLRRLLQPCSHCVGQPHLVGSFLYLLVGESSFQ